MKTCGIYDLSGYTRDLELRGLAETSLISNIRIAKMYLSWAQENHVDPTEKASLLLYLEHLRRASLSSVTIKTYYSRLSTFFEYLIESELIKDNPVRQIRKRYLRAYKDPMNTKQIISVDDASRMVRATLDLRDRAILLMLFKTGVRVGELISLDIDDVDFEKQTLYLKPTAKRSNRVVFFDDESARVLRRWIAARETRYRKRNERALFIGVPGNRLGRTRVFEIARDAAERVGLHDPNSDRPEDHFSPHCCRHWFTTHLIRSGMPRDYIKWLRGDAIVEAIDIYNHIDPEDVKRSYMAHIPMLGV